MTSVYPLPLAAVTAAAYAALWLQHAYIAAPPSDFASALYVVVLLAGLWGLFEHLGSGGVRRIEQHLLGVRRILEQHRNAEGAEARVDARKEIGRRDEKPHVQACYSQHGGGPSKPPDQMAG